MKIALVNFNVAADGFAAELADRLRVIGHAVERIRFPLVSTPRGRLAAGLIRFDSGGSDLVVLADNIDRAGGWDETIRRVLTDGSLEVELPNAPQLTDEESLALADSVSAILAELGSNELDDLAETIGRHIAGRDHFPRTSVYRICPAVSPAG